MLTLGGVGNAGAQRGWWGKARVGGGGGCARGPGGLGGAQGGVLQNPQAPGKPLGRGAFCGGLEVDCPPGWRRGEERGEAKMEERGMEKVEESLPRNSSLSAAPDNAANPVYTGQPVSTF